MRVMLLPSARFLEVIGWTNKGIQNWSLIAKKNKEFMISTTPAMSIETIFSYQNWAFIEP